MRVYRELTIRGEPDQVAATMEAIAAGVSGDWSRDTQSEEELHRSSGFEWYCYICNKRGERPGAKLLLADDAFGNFRVAGTNHPPGRKLSYREYNDVVEEFYRLFVCPAVAKTGAVAELTDAEADLEHWLSAETAAKLRRFNAAANRHSGSRHPAARKLWYDFLAAAHREDTKLDASTLAQWLREDGGWNEEWADDLAGEYGFARGLLAYTDQRTAVGV